MARVYSEKRVRAPVHKTLAFLCGEEYQTSLKPRSCLLVKYNLSQTRFICLCKVSQTDIDKLFQKWVLRVDYMFSLLAPVRKPH